MRVRIALPIIFTILTLAALNAWKDSDEFLPSDFHVPYGRVYRHVTCLLMAPPLFEAELGRTKLILHAESITLSRKGTYIILSWRILTPVTLACAAFVGCACLNPLTLGGRSVWKR